MATILFADDEPWLLDSIFSRLRNNHHEVLTAESADEALDVLQQHPVHLLVLDIMMPYEPLEMMLRRGVDAVVNSVTTDVWTGIRLYEEVRKAHPGLKIAVLSVNPEQEIQSQAAEHNILMDNCVFLRKGGVDSAENLEKLLSLLPHQSDGTKKR